MKKENTVPTSLFSNKFNAMTLFAYQGDCDKDNFANAFIGENKSKLDKHYL